MFTTKTSFQTHGHRYHHLNGDWADGGSGYEAPWNWLNIAKTGGLLAEMKFVGDTISSVQVQDAVDFIDWNWDADGEYFPANSYNAFYSVMKGLRLLGIETITPINVSLQAAEEAEF